MAIDIVALADKAAEELSQVSHDRNLQFLQITERVLKGRLSQRAPEFPRRLRELRDELKRRSAKKRSTSAARKREFARTHERVAS